MQDIFSYIIKFGAPVMMPIIFTIIGVCIGMKFGKALKSGLYVGVGFVGLGIVTALLTDNFKSPLEAISKIFELNLSVFDMGWPAAAAVAYNTAVGALIIPICLGINFLLLITKCTRTVNIDLWNYWHFAFIGAVAYFTMGQSLVWGYFAAITCYIITLVMADLTASKFQGYYDNMDGISIPQPFVQSFTPFAIVINWMLDKIPGFSKLDIDAEGLKKKFGVLGEPIVLGVIVGALIGLFSHVGHIADIEAYRQYLINNAFDKSLLDRCIDALNAAFKGGTLQDATVTATAMTEGIKAASVTTTDAIMRIVKDVLFLGVTMGAVMELIPRITRLFIDGLMPISEKTQEVVGKKFKGRKIYIGMSPALVIGHPTTLVVSLLLIPVTLVIAIVLPNNQFLPLASLAGMFYVFVMVLPYTKGNVVKTFVIGLVALTIGLWFVTDMAYWFTQAANAVFAETADKAAKIPEGFSAGALDFASSLMGWAIYKLTCGFRYAFKSSENMGLYIQYACAAVLLLITVGMVVWNRMRIVRDEKQQK